MDEKEFERLLLSVQKPGRYSGGEINSVIKNKTQVDVRFAFCFPDTYEVGMSHLGMKILYHILNKRENFYCERVFAPWTDMEAAMRQNGVPLFSLESFSPVADFDLVGFTLQYEMSYTNVLNMMDLAGIPMTWQERDAAGAPFSSVRLRSRRRDGGWKSRRSSGSSTAARGRSMARNSPCGGASRTAIAAPSRDWMRRKIARSCVRNRSST